MGRKNSHRHTFHVGLNVMGMVLPMLVGVLTVPGLLQRLGQERFGILALGWALVGYFGFLDLGMGRALTQYLASAENAGIPRTEQTTVACAARRLIGGFSIVWALLLWFLMPWGASFLQMPPDLQAQTLGAIPLLVLAVPLTMWFACNSGVLEARSRFGAVNSVRIPLGVANSLLPWLVSFYTTELAWVLASLLWVRLMGALGMAWWARPEFANPSPQWSAQGIIPLLQFGGWMTLSNLISPLMAYFDRFAIAALVSVAAVTHYTVPFDMLSRLPMVPISIMGVLLPLMAQMGTKSPINNNINNSIINPEITKTMRFLLVCWVPGMVLMAWIGPYLLTWWVGAEMSQASTPIWRWLAVGVLVNGVAHLPFTVLQSAGRTDIIAKTHLLELLPYCVALWWALAHYGVMGAAVVWSLRVGVDAALLCGSALWLFPHWRSFLKGVVVWALGGTVATVGVALWGGYA